MALLPQNELFRRAYNRAGDILATSNIDITKLDSTTQPLLARLIVKYQHDLQYNKLAYYQPYEYQKPLYRLTTMAQAVIASNRSGKSYSVGYAIACHLTGIYPDWWTDIRYPCGIKCIVAGSSTAQIREAIQETLFGTSDKTDEIALGSGLLPKDSIILSSIVTGADKRAIGGCQIRHSSGSLSQLIVASYEQDRAVLQGGKCDVIWLDEQPRDDEIVSELVRALAQTPSGMEGRLYLSATPLVGWTPMIKRFWNGEPHHSMVRYSWDDVPTDLLDTKTRELLMSSWLPWEIESRTRGIPMAGVGAVFQVDFDSIILADTPQLKPHYRLLSGIDFGRSPDPTAVVWCAYDPNTDIIYVYDEYIGRNLTPIEYAPHILARGRNIPLAWPPDGNRKGYTETTSAITELTVKYGINTLGEPFTNPDGSRGIDYGLQYIIQRMRMGKFLISPHCRYLIDELRQYHTERSLNGRMHFRGSDHAIDALRYCALSIERWGVALIDEFDPLQHEANMRWINKFELNKY